MPILNVEMVTRPGETMQANLAQEIADEAGVIFCSPAGNTWVKVRALPTEQYAENYAGAMEPVYPVFVSVLKAALPAGAEIQREVAQLAEMVARACGRPAEIVHVLYCPAGAGRDGSLSAGT